MVEGDPAMIFLDHGFRICLCSACPYRYTLQELAFEGPLRETRRD